MLQGGLKMAAMVGAGLLATALPLHAQYVYYESFTGTAAPGWTFVEGLTSPGPRLTADASPNGSDPEFGSPQLDADGNGWLRLATTEGYQHNIVALNTAIPSNANTVTVTFDFTMWGGAGSNADGISLFLFDAAEPFSYGANGGSLAYEQKSDQTGLKGGYVAVGLDVYGNFSNDTEGRSGAYNANNPNSPINVPDGLEENQVVVRGPDRSGTVNTDTYSGTGITSYNLLAATGGVNYTTGQTPIKDLGGTNSSNSYFYDSGHNQLDYANQDFRPDQDAEQYRRLQVSLDDNDQLTVNIEFGKNTGFVELYTVDLSGFARPESLRLGFGAATGGSINVHEIRNLIVTASGLDDTWYWWNQSGDGLWNTANNWNPNDSKPDAMSDVVFGNKVGTYVVTTTPTTVTMNGNQTIGSIFFTGTQSYTIAPSSSQTLTLDTNDGLNESYISITNNPDGNADHTLNVNLTAANKVNIDNLVSQTLTIGSSSQTRTFDLAGNELEVNSHGTTTIWSNIGGGSGSDITKTGTGRLNLFGSNSFNGVVTVENGILAIRQNNGLGNSSGVTVMSGGTLGLDATSGSFNSTPLTITGNGFGGLGALRNIAGNNTWNGATTLSGTAAIGADAGTRLTMQGGINGSGNLVVAGAGTVYLNNSKNYSGTTTVRSGTLEVASQSAMGSSSGTIQLGDSLTAGSDTFSLLVTQGGQSITRAINVNNYGAGATIGGTSGTTTFSGGVTLGRDTSLYAGSGSTVNFSGAFSGSGGLDKTGTGVVSISNTGNNFTGDVSVSAGRLDLSGTLGSASTITIGDGVGGAGSDILRLQSGSSNRIGNSSDVHLASSGRLELNNLTETIGSLSGATGSQIVTGGSSANLTFGEATDSTFAGVVSGSGGTLTKSGTGTTTFSGQNTWNGTMAIGNGAIALGADDVFSDSSTISLTGGTLMLQGFSDTIADLNLSVNSTIDFGGGASDFIFLGGTRTGGTLFIDNWTGVIGGGGVSGVDDRLLIDLANLGNYSGYDVSDFTFVGVGSGVEVVAAESGLGELVPTFSGWYEWDSGASNDKWNSGQNWVGDSTPPNSSSTDVLFAGGVVAGQTIDLVNNNPQVRNMVISNDVAFTFGSSGRLNFNTASNSGISYLTITGDSSPTFARRVDIEDNLVVNNNSTGEVTFSNQVVIDGDNDSGSRNLTFRGAGTTAVTGAISDNGDNDTVTKEGSGTLRLTASNSFGGGFNLLEGLVQIGNNNALGNAGTVTIEGGALEAYGAARTLYRAISIEDDFSVTGSNVLSFGSGTTLSSGMKTIDVASGAELALINAVTGTGGIRKTGTGTLTFSTSATKSFSGGLEVTEGLVNVSGGAAFDIGAASGYAGSGPISVSGGSFNATLGGGAFNLYSGSSINVSGGSFSAVSSSNSINISGSINSSGGTTEILGGSSVTLNGTSAINISGGAVSLGGKSSFNANSGSSIAMSGGSLDIDMTRIDGTASAVNFNSSTISINGSGTVMNVKTETNSNVLFDNGIVNLTNGGTLNVLQGDVTLRNGVDLNGGMGVTKGTMTLTEDLYLGQVDVASRPNITINAAGNTVIAKDSAYAPAEISIINLGTITKNGAGTTTISSNINNIEASTVVINQGTLLLADHDQLANSNNMVLNSGTFSTGAHNEVLNHLTLSSTSTIDLGNQSGGSSILRFEGGGTRTTGTLRVDNWNGIAGTGGGQDQLIFGTTLTDAFLSNVYWVDQNIWGAIQLGTGEIVPVPEPGVIVTCVLIVGAIGFDVRRRRKAASGEKEETLNVER